MNYLTIVFDDPTIVKDGDVLIATRLGAPDREEFKRRFYSFMTDPDNYYKYLFNIKVIVKPEYDWIKQEVAQTLYECNSALGSYKDSLLGLQNLFANLPLIHRTTDLSDVRPGTTHALAVMAGPSLASYYDRIREAKDAGALIVVCDAAAKPLFDAGIDPHFIATSERVMEVTPFFSSYPWDRSDARVLANFVTHPETIKAIPEERLVFCCRNNIEMHFFEFVERTMFSVPPHVASYTLGALTAIGCTYITYVGMDLAYAEDGTSHVQGMVGDYDDWTRPRTEYMQEHGVMDAIAADGSTIKTSRLWHAFGRQLEETIRILNLNVYTMNPKSLKVKGIEFSESYIGLGMNQNSITPISLEKSNRGATEKNEVSDRIHVLMQSMTTIDTSLDDISALDIGCSVFESAFGWLAYSLLLRAWACYQSDVYSQPGREIEHRRVFLSCVRQAIVDLQSCCANYISKVSHSN